MSSQPSSKAKPLTEVEGPNGVVWRITKQLGSGSFGDVFLAVQNENTKEAKEVAIKVEALKAAHPQLAYEARLLSLLRGNKGVSQVYFSGVQKGYNVLVMECLSHSLEDLIVMCNGRFSLKSTLLLADQLLCRMEDVHAASFVHRDIKPENFLLGRNEHRNTVFVIDFGLSKRYCDGKTGEHIPYKDNKSLTGTARYASINAHRGVEQSRRDDLEAIGHMMMYFLRGNLPWQGLPAKTKDEKYRKIKEKKIETSIESLCAGFPEEFATYIMYVRSMRFQDRPDYAYLKGLFRDRYIAEGYDKEQPTFDWSAKIDALQPKPAANAYPTEQAQAAPQEQKTGNLPQQKPRAKKLCCTCGDGGEKQ